MTRAQRLACQLAGIAITLGVWEIGGQYLGDALLAPPSLVAVVYVDLLREGEMLRELVSSLRQMLLGFGLACAIGMPLGIAMGRSRLVDAIFHPWISMLVVSSVAALVPLFILLFGTGFQFRAAIVFVASVGYIVLTAYHGARGIEPRFLEVARAFGSGRIATFLKVIMPALHPYLLTGTRLGLIHAIRAMVVAEMFIILGYGGLIYQTGLDVSTAPLLGLLLTLMAVSIGATQLLRLVGRRLAPWYEQRMAMPS